MAQVIQRGIRDVEEWYVSTVTRHDYIHEVFERQCKIALADLERIHQAVGERVTVAFVTGTDFGMQTGPFISPKTYRGLYKPFHKRVNDWVHGHTAWKTFVHSCGSVMALIEDFIEAGFDILNPVQCSAAGMDPAELKRRFGDRITFDISFQSLYNVHTMEEEFSSRRYQIRMYLQHARRALESAASNLGQGFCATAINRAYYAIFYAASALLLTKGISRSKHTGVISAFRKHFVKPGLIEAEYSDLYGDAMDARVGSDYDVTFESDPVTAQERLDDARRFIDRVTGYLFDAEGIQ